MSSGWAAVLPHARLGALPGGYDRLRSHGFRVVALTPSPDALAADRAAAEAAEERDLADVGERVGDRPLEELLGRGRERRVGGEGRVEPREAGVEPRDLLLPGERLRVLPRGRPVGHRHGPVEEVPDVREDLARRLRRRADLQRFEAFRRVADRLAAAVRERGDGVAEELSCGVSFHAVFLPSPGAGRAAGSAGRSPPTRAAIRP